MLNRRMLVALAALGLVLGACSKVNPSGGGATSPSSSASPPNCGPTSPMLYQSGQLTVATDSPAYSPWFSKNKPSNGKGYESAVAYAVAAQLGFSTSQVTWVVEPFDNSYAPGPKKFDFDINEITITPQRAQAVTFSDGYYEDTQAIVAMKNNPIVTKHSPSDLKTYQYGDQIGTTSLQFIQSSIQPTKTPRIYNTLNDVKQALVNGQIDAFVTDTPTAQYISSAEIKGSTVVGQFHSTEQFGMLFAKGNPFVACVNQALAKLKANGTLQQLQQRWLGVYNRIPLLQP